ncbi:hypothetical protein ACPV4B_03170 [Vibrio parahaemolyticus]|uniref:NADH-quinone oxidoreductase subunit B family protein n=1 Tax=Vibrio mediterranei TaxID=689 RepID=UPI0040694744
MTTTKTKIAVHKLTSCSGCQLAFINQGPGLLSLLEHIEICHFIEAGIDNPEYPVDVAFIEGSISTPHDLERIKSVRALSKLVVTVGACATSGGVQALRNLACLYDEPHQLKARVYAAPEHIAMLAHSQPVATAINVDFELWGCPISTEQLLRFLSQLLVGAKPKLQKEKLCMECKRQQNVCVMVTKQALCLGPVIRTGCGAMCPSYGKACYGCNGPSEQPNTRSLANRMQGLGAVDSDIAQRFAQFHGDTPQFRAEIEHWIGHKEEKQ